MNDLGTIVGVTAVTFAATSLDNLGLLVVLSADQGFRSRDIYLGYLGAASLVVVAAYWAAEALEALPHRHMSLIGLVPIGLGVFRFYRLRRPNSSPEVRRSGALAAGAAPVALMMLAQSADFFAAYTAVFTDTAERLELPILATAAVCVLAWCQAARWLVTRRAIAGPIERWAPYAVPPLLILVGMYILLDTGTDAVGIGG